MTNQPKIPNAETRARSVAKLRELVKRWDALIADLDELNARLEAENQKGPLAEYLRRREQRLTAQKQKSSSPGLPA